MNKINFTLTLSLILILLSGCLNNNPQKVSEITAPMKSEEEAIEKEKESFESIPVFNISAEDVYDALKGKSGEVQINKENDTTTYLDENNDFELYVNNLYSERIDQFYTTIYKTDFKNDNNENLDMESFYGLIFELIDIPFNEEEFIELLKKTDLTKDRKDKTTSYYEDIVITKFESIWLGIEGIYTSDSAKDPAYIEVRIYPEEPTNF